MKKSYDRITATFEKLNAARIKNIGKMSKSDFSRDRKMPFSDIIRCILNKRGKTITMEINNYFKEIDKNEQRITKQAFCKQRCKLNPVLIIFIEIIYLFPI